MGFNYSLKDPIGSNNLFKDHNSSKILLVLIIGSNYRFKDPIGSNFRFKDPMYWFKLLVQRSFGSNNLFKDHFGSKILLVLIIGWLTKTFSNLFITLQKFYFQQIFKDCLADCWE